MAKEADGKDETLKQNEVEIDEDNIKHDMKQDCAQEDYHEDGKMEERVRVDRRKLELLLQGFAMQCY